MYMSAPVTPCMPLAVYLGCRTLGNVGFSLGKVEIVHLCTEQKGHIVSEHRLKHLPGTLAWDALSQEAPASL